MAKTDVNSWDLNPDNNTDVNGVNIAEGCPPSGINNAIRAMMAQIKAFITNAVFTTLSATKVYATSNGDGKAVAVGDDVWLGDVNATSTLSVQGQSDATSGYIQFGSQTTRLGVSAGGALSYGSNALVHAGNIGGYVNGYLSGYASLSGATWGSTGENGGISLSPGTTSASGQIQLYAPSGSRVGFIYQPASGTGANTLVFGKDDGNGFTFIGGILNAIAGLAINGTSLSSIFAPLSNPTFTGNLTAPFLKADANAYLTVSGNYVYLNFDVNRYLKLDRTSGKLYYNGGSGECVSFDSSGNIRITGNLYAAQGGV